MALPVAGVCVRIGQRDTGIAELATPPHWDYQAAVKNIDGIQRTSLDDALEGVSESAVRALKAM